MGITNNSRHKISTGKQQIIQSLTDWTNLGKFGLNGAAARVDVLTMQTILCLSSRLDAVKLAKDGQEMQQFAPHTTTHIPCHSTHVFIFPCYVKVKLFITS